MVAVPPRAMRMTVFARGENSHALEPVSRRMVMIAAARRTLLCTLVPTLVCAYDGECAHGPPVGEAE